MKGHHIALLGRKKTFQNVSDLIRATDKICHELTICNARVSSSHLRALPLKWKNLCLQMIMIMSEDDDASVFLFTRVVLLVCFSLISSPLGWMMFPVSLEL